MVKELIDDDHSSGGSSIALLQERFRQLQRMKELRQEKQLLRMLSESERPYSQSTFHDHRLKTLPGSSENVFLRLPPPTRPYNCQLSLSLWPDSQTKHPDSRGLIFETPPSKAFLFNNDVCTSLPIKNVGTCDHSDIDTSLRL